MANSKNSSLHASNLPVVSDIFITLPQKVFSELTSFANLIFELAQDVLKAYTSGHFEISHFIEYGLSDELIYLLHKRQFLHKILLRYDFFLTESGPKLIEISSNPWGLITTYHTARKFNSLELNILPAYEIYLNLCNLIKPRNIGIWKDFGFNDEIEDLIKMLEKESIHAKRIDERDVVELQKFDAILFDIDTAYFNNNLSFLTKYPHQLLPPLGNEIIKRKNFLALVYAFVTNSVSLDSRLSEDDKKFLQKFLVPTYLIPDQTSILFDNKFDQGVIKDVIGIWGRQVTILSPRLSSETGPHARKARQEFKKHLKKAIEQKNAIFQEYIQFKSLEEYRNLHAEISIISNYEEYHPFVRLWENNINDGPSKPTIGFVKML